MVEPTRTARAVAAFVTIGNWFILGTSALLMMAWAVEEIDAWRERRGDTIVSRPDQGYWRIFTNRRGDPCGAAMAFRGGDALSLHWLPANDRLDLWLDAPELRQVRGFADGAAVAVRVRFAGGDRMVHAFTDPAATEKVSDKGVRSILLTGDMRLLDRFRDTTEIAVAVAGHETMALLLDDPTAMVARLRSCDAAWRRMRTA